MTKLIAEIGWNHMGDMTIAEKMIKEASESGADYAKFQTWNVNRLKSGSWDNDGRREIYEKAMLTEDLHVFLINICKKYNINFLSSAFSKKDAELLLKLECKEIKIPSFEIANRELIDFCKNNFERIYLSTGTATEEEIKDVTENLKHSDYILMHCVSSYPCTVENINLPRINVLTHFAKKVGFSDHTSGINAAKVSLEYSPFCIEKHFTIDNNLPGRDNKFAILPQDMKSLSEFIIDREKCLGFHGLNYQEIEGDSRENYRGRFDA